MSETPETPAPAAPPQAPAVHGDTLWDGPRFIMNAGPEPVWVETKQQYWDLLSKMGFLMKDQQESTTGPEQAPQSWITPTGTPEIIPPRDFTSEEAEILFAYQATLRQYGLLESLSCVRCFTRGVPHGMRAYVSPTQIRFECRCGVAAYRPLTGTTDRPHFSNTAKVLGDRTRTDLTDAHGRRYLPTELLTRDAARAFRQIAKLYTARDYDPSLFCSQCYDGQASETTAAGLSISPDQVRVVCRCRVLFYAGHTL